MESGAEGIKKEDLTVNKEDVEFSSAVSSLVSQAFEQIARDVESKYERFYLGKLVTLGKSEKAIDITNIKNEFRSSLMKEYTDRLFKRLSESFPNRSVNEIALQIQANLSLLESHIENMVESKLS